MLTASLIIGVVVSLALVELLGLSAGGVIVPGYVALLLDRPAALAGFMLVAFASFGLVRLSGNWLMLYGNRRFSIAILAGMTLSVGAQNLAPGLAPTWLDWAGLGFIVPGLLAHQFIRQGVWPTLAMLAIAASIVRIILLVVARWA